jgi:NAD(P)-dependent dehydrogenase (short-subunit alcohol dehydrogenase family)
MPQQASRTLLRTDASYLLVGGLGGLGRAIALWMVDHGARAIIFASPSGAAKQEAKDTIRAIEEQGALVSVFNCDVSDVKHLDTVINQASQSMPPIRGIIQMAMVMRVSTFQHVLEESKLCANVA